MISQIEADIVQRALIALLTPESHRQESRPKIENIKELHRPSGAAGTPARIYIIEQLTSQTVTVCWSDPQSGHYAEQLWRKGAARRSSFCILTGMRIRPGDAVFRPRAGKSHVPVNRKYMLLAAAVPDKGSLVT
jgi:hypothetical protein